MKSHRIVTARLLFLAIGLATVGLGGGCNTILDNKPGTFDKSRTSTTPTEPDPTADTGDDVSHGGDIQQPDASTPDTTPDSRCGEGQQWCSGLCVSADDPTYGCGDPACAPCPAAHGTAMCQNRACILHSCDPGFADCNRLPADGCETDLSKPTSCGACGTLCPAAAPVCAPAGPSFQCASGCPAGAPLRCGNECVSPLSSVNHCGACDAKCPDVQFADVSCVFGACTTTCKPNHHLCAGKCVVDTDATACGASCTVCPPVTNGVPTCSANACSFTCNPGFADCNASAVDGCERNLTNDPLNCGACGRSCNGGTCVNSVCTAPPPDAGP